MASSVTKLIKELKKFLKADQILDKDVDLRLYDTDASSLFKQKPLLVVLPNDTQEVQAIINSLNKINQANCLRVSQDCNSQGLQNEDEGSWVGPNDQKTNEHNIVCCDTGSLSFVARGAGTGLSGGAIAFENSIIISLARLTKVIKIDREQQIAVVEPGVVNERLSEDCASQDLHFAPDPSSQNACTIGGNVAENAGGIHCYKYGVTSDHVLGLEMVLPDGRIKYFGALLPDDQIDLSYSPAMAKLICGSEGTFGVVTKALVKLTPRPESFITMQVCYGSLTEATNSVREIIAADFKPSALELIDEGALKAVNKAYDLGLGDEVKAILLIELDGFDEDIKLEAEMIKNLINNHFEPISYEETQDVERKNFLWKVRKGVAAAFGQIAPYWYLYDAVVPRSKIPVAMEEIEKIAERHSLTLASIAHAADGNLHPNFLYDPDKDSTVVDRIHKASKEIMQTCIKLGGTLSGEHGIGVEKQEYMDDLFSRDDMDLMLAVRKVFDPEMKANPNKLFPIRICREHFGGDCEHTGACEHA